MDEYQEIPLSQIRPPEVPVRSLADEDKFLELVYSLTQHGMIQPIVVRKAGEHYEVVVGHRRYLAAQSAGMETVPCIVREMDQKAVDIARLEENVKREDINPLDEARYYRYMLDIHKMTQDELAEIVGKSRSSIAHRLRLLDTPKDIREAVERGEIGAQVAHDLARVKDPEDRAYYLHYAKQDGASERVVRKWVQDWESRQEVLAEPMRVREQFTAVHEVTKSAWQCRYCQVEGHVGYLVSIWVCDECLSLIDQAFAAMAAREEGAQS